MLNSFHGRTMGALTATGAAEVPRRASSRCCPASRTPRSATWTAATKPIDDETCAIMVEPIQGEGGVNLPPTGYLEGLRSCATSTSCC